MGANVRTSRLHIQYYRSVKLCSSKECRSLESDFLSVGQYRSCKVLISSELAAKLTFPDNTVSSNLASILFAMDLSLSFI